MSLHEPASANWLKRVAAGCGCGVLVIYLGLFALARWLGPLQEIGQASGCQNNLRIVTRGLRMYADDYEDRFPPAPEWMDRMIAYTDGEQRLRCPSVGRPDGNKYGYAMNEKVSAQERRTLDAPERIPLAYDSSNLMRSAHDPYTSLPVPGRHRVRAQKGGQVQAGNVVGYADGSGKFRVSSSSALPERAAP